MSIELAKQYGGPVDEIFKAESKRDLLTNTNYDWTGAHSVSVWKVSTVPMNDYARSRSAEDEGDGTAASLSRYGAIIDLDAQTEEMLLTRDRSFIFNIDKLDQDETANQVRADTALARQIREVVIPEVDSYIYGVMVKDAGTKATPAALTAENIYDEIVKGTETLDDAEIPETERVLVVTPATYRLMKQCPDIAMDCDVSAEMRAKGVVGTVDGMNIAKIPASRLPQGFGFMIAHPSATVAPTKLEDYGVYSDTPLSSGTIVTGRVCYDCFTLENKRPAIYYYPIA